MNGVARAEASPGSIWLRACGSVTTSCFGTVAMLYRLRARVDVRTIYLRERIAAGWGPP